MSVYISPEDLLTVIGLGLLFVAGVFILSLALARISANSNSTGQPKPGKDN